MANFLPFFFRFSDIEADPSGAYGQVINFYNSYANALAHGSTGLITVRSYDALGNHYGAVISQTAKTAGPTVDVNGLVVVCIDSSAYSEVYAMGTAGRFGGPRRFAISSVGTAVLSESSSSQSSDSSSHSVSSSSSLSSSSESSSHSISSSSSNSSSSSLNSSSSSNSSSSTSNSSTSMSSSSSSS